MATFLWVSRFGPLPYCFEDSVVYRNKGFFTGSMPVIIRPASYDGVEDAYQVSSRGLLVTFDDFSGLREEGLDILP
jgi:hypothetical protein